MKLGQSRLQQIVTYGLSESEAKVYLALLDHPGLGAGALAKTTSVPRTHLYGVLESLQGLGLAEVYLSGSTRTYRARPLSEYVERRIREQRSHLEEMESRLDNIRAVFVPAAEPADATEAGGVKLLVGRRAIAREIDRMLADAKSRVTILSSDHGAARVLRHLETSAPAEGVLFEIYLPRSARAGGTHERLPQRILDGVRWHEHPMPMLVAVRDEREALWIQPSPDDGQFRAGNDRGVLSANTAFVSGFVRLLRGACGGGAP